MTRKAKPLKAYRGSFHEECDVEDCNSRGSVAHRVEVVYVGDRETPPVALAFGDDERAMELARLIAAAPDMLSALKEASDDADFLARREGALSNKEVRAAATAIRDRLRVAITKASPAQLSS